MFHGAKRGGRHPREKADNPGFEIWKIRCHNGPNDLDVELGTIDRNHAEQAIAA
jgi:hypothetical protein